MPTAAAAEARVEAQARLGVRAEPRRAAEGADLDDAAERVAIGRGGVDRREHALLGGGIRAADLARARARRRPRRRPRRRAGLDVADRAARARAPRCRAAPSRPFVIAPTATRAAVSRAEARSSTLRTSSRSYFMTPERSAWPGRGSYDLAAAARGDLGELLLADRPGAHRRAPVGVVAVAHDQRERAAEREPVAHAAEDLDVVLLDLLPRAAPVARLPAPEIEADRLAVEREPRGQAGDHGGDSRAVRLPRGDAGQIHASEGSEAGCGRAVRPGRAGGGPRPAPRAAPAAARAASRRRSASPAGGRRARPGAVRRRRRRRRCGPGRCRRPRRRRGRRPRRAR